MTDTLGKPYHVISRHNPFDFERRVNEVAKAGYTMIFSYSLQEVERHATFVAIMKKRGRK